MISIFGNIEFKLIIMFNLHSILSCQNLLKNCYPNIHSNLDCKVDFCNLSYAAFDTDG